MSGAVTQTLTDEQILEQVRASIDWATFYEKREKRDRAERVGDICYECFKELPHKEYALGDTVYQIREHGVTAPVCLDCAPKVLAETGLYIPEQVKIIPAKYRYEWQCSGPMCSRMVAFLDQKPPRRSRVFCSQECRKVPPKQREKTCQVCGQEFTATRSDAKTCSAGCRQKAYRQRKL